MLAAAGVVLALGVLLPPFETYAWQYALAQALQFVIFAVAAPALLVAGAPPAHPRGLWLAGPGLSPHGSPGGPPGMRQRARRR